MTGRKELFEQAMSQGHSAAWDQLWDRAARFYQSALEEFPEDSKALISYGMALFELQDHSQALEVYLRAARVHPEDPIPVEKVSLIYERMDETSRAAEAAMRAAELYLKKGDAEKAILIWSRVTRLDPEHTMAHSRLALAHERLGRKQQAVTEYLALASLLQHGGRRDEAIQIVNHALKLLPGNSEARQALMMIDGNQPLPQPVRPSPPVDFQELSQVPQLVSPDDEDLLDRDLDPIAETEKKALAELAMMLFELSDETGDEKPVRRGLKEITDGFAPGSEERGERASLIYSLRQAVDYQTRGQDDQALQQLEQALEMGVDLPAVHYCLGRLYARMDQPDAAMRHLQRAVKHPDYVIGARLLVGDILHQGDRLKDAAVEYLEALKLADSQVVSPEQAAALAQSYEPLIEAHVQEADEEDHEQLCVNIAELLVRPNWRRRLTEARRELLSQDSETPPPLAEIITQARSSQIVGALATIHQYARRGLIRLAMEEAFRALDYAPTYLPLHALMGELLIQQEQVDEAIVKFVTVAKAYSSRGESSRSIDLFRRVVELAPMDLEGRQRLIVHLVHAGKTEQALGEYLELADVYIRLAELEKARMTFAEALQLAQQPNVNRSWSVRTLHLMADIDLQRLDWRQALKTYEQLRELEPADEKARTSLIDLNLRMGQENTALSELDNYIVFLQNQGRQDHIVELLENTVNSHPRYNGVRQRLAQIYQRIGRIDAAVEQWDRVGDSLLDAGDKPGAIMAIQAIIALNPPNVEDYERVLNDLTA